MHEVFDKGVPSELKDHIYVEDERREMRFYPSTRLDGLLKRELIFGKKVCSRYIL